SYIWFASTWVSNLAPVIVRVISKIFNVAMEIVVSTTTREGRMLGTVICRNICHPLTPSSLAASMMSSGTALIAADNTTIANPAWIQIITAMRKTVFHGESCRNRTGSKPRRVSRALSTPICTLLPPRYSYTNFQMIPAPTKEIAIGMNNRVLATFSSFDLSTTTAYTRPMKVEMIGPSSTQRNVWRNEVSAAELVNMHAEFSHRASSEVVRSKKDLYTARSAGPTSRTTRSSAAGPPKTSSAKKVRVRCTQRSAAHAMKSRAARTARKARTTPAIWTSLSLAVKPIGISHPLTANAPLTATARNAFWRNAGCGAACSPPHSARASAPGVLDLVERILGGRRAIDPVSHRRPERARPHFCRHHVRAVET